MQKPDPELVTSAVRLTEDIGRIRLSKSFFFRDFLYSEVATVTGLPNIPSDLDAAVWAGRRLCEDILEPLQEMLGPIRIRSGYRSETVNRYGNHHRLGCASNQSNYGRHIWDRLDERGARGAMACVVLPPLTDHYQRTGDWQSFAWFLHDHLPYSEMTFFTRLAAFNIGWSEEPKRTIDSFISPQKGYLVRPDLLMAPDNHGPKYVNVPALKTAAARRAQHLDGPEGGV
ncbi:hypothetical protein [Brevundimonas sp.]|uniref:hypothetical protein n=1 Tax=Brevundimonas sp. TaxID=1871086 RepID=UPI002607E9C4|nr:hypothetical protein [Brevundimonas sp.]